MNSGIVINKKLDSAIKSKLTDDLGYSQLNLENNKSVIMAQTVAPKKGHQLDVCVFLCRIMWVRSIPLLGSGMAKASIDILTNSSLSRATIAKVSSKGEES